MKLLKIPWAIVIHWGLMARNNAPSGYRRTIKAGLFNELGIFKSRLI